MRRGEGVGLGYWGGPTLRGRRWVSYEKGQAAVLVAPRWVTRDLASHRDHIQWVRHLHYNNKHQALPDSRQHRHVTVACPDVFISYSVSVNRIKLILMKGELRYRYSLEVYTM